MHCMLTNRFISLSKPVSPMSLLSFDIKYFNIKLYILNNKMDKFV